MGLINVVVDSSSPDDVFAASLSLAKTLCSHPQQCMRGDRLSSLSIPLGHGQSSGPGRWNVQGEERRALELEFEHGANSLAFLGQALEDFVHRKKPSKM